MSNELIINASLPETRIALMEDGEIQELLIERASGKGIVGNIYKGRVTRVLPGMQAAFVDIGLEKAAFLYVDDVYVHSEIWEAEEGEEPENPISVTPGETVDASPSVTIKPALPEDASDYHDEYLEEGEEDDESEEEDRDPVEMGKDPHDSGETGEVPEDTIAPESDSPEVEGEASTAEAQSPGRRRHRRGRRGGRFRRKGTGDGSEAPVEEETSPEAPLSPLIQPLERYPENYHEQVAETGALDSDRSGLAEESAASVEAAATESAEAGRPENTTNKEANSERRTVIPVTDRSEFRAQRSRDRRIRQKVSSRPLKAQVNIQDLLKEGQEVLVQVAKDPISTKGARLTCHISLPGRHLVCMPTIDHVGVSRRIEREDERRRLREYVERNRPRNLGFIVRTASGKQQSEKRIKQDIDYLTRLWNEIREKASCVTAPSLIYEDLNSVLRAIRDWVTEEIDKVIVDSRYHYNEILRFVSHFMPSLKHKVELYHGDIPIFDAYGISTELSRALERKVWLKSGGYIVVDQAEALVAIDVNTGRYVGKKNLEDTILKTNLEAVQEIAYQLRLRNCGGIIILDLIDMEKDENKQRVYRALEDALSRDRARPTILKISELGLVEMTRKRTRDTIVRSLCESCTHCEGKGFIKSKQTVGYEVLREIEREGIDREVSKILVQAHPDVIDILAIDERDTLDQMERRYRKLIYLQAVNDFHPEQFEVTADKRERAERERPNDPSHERNPERSPDRNRHRQRQDSAQGASVTIIPTSGILPVIVPSLPKPLATPTIIPVDHSASPLENSASVTLALPNSNGAADGFDEEDRLAFVRAQAAQDAALARSGNNSSHHPRGPSELPNRGGLMGGAPRRGARGRRGATGAPSVGGGKFRRGNDRNRSRNPKSFGYAPNQKWNETSQEAAAPAHEEPIAPATPAKTEGGSSGGGQVGGGW